MAATVKMPWGLSLFLVAIFALAYPFDPSHSQGLGDAGLDETAQLIEKGSVQGLITLFSLELFALVTRLSKKRSRLRVNGPLGWLVLFFFSLAVALSSHA
jgi:multisubunit Na+/H+ antiporter MnhB subunit